MSTERTGERLAVLVHEVRSSVAAIAALAEALRRDGLRDVERRELVRMAVSASHAIERIVVGASLTSLEREVVDVGALVVDAKVAAVLRGARVRLDVSSKLPPLVADPVRLRQALDNLVANALAQAPESEIVLGARAESAFVALWVADSGPGIPERERLRIFEPGVRLDASYAGSGLGLAVVKAIAEAHGGHVTVDSVPGAGARFALVLPVTPAEGR